ncbi:MAG TPA: hypothetical protein VFX16_13215 [Pseudonocardiaceae bacterium]|nr:hypothetical protein [Pseudonocardiaceae bacterium]
MSVKLAVAVSTFVVGAFVLAGCDAAADQINSVTSSKSYICGKALGVIALSEVGDDARRKAKQARNAADVLNTLATQTQDQSLSEALRAAASQAGQVNGQDWSGAKLQAWATQEQARFNTLKAACD